MPAWLVKLGWVAGRLFLGDDLGKKLLQALAVLAGLILALVLFLPALVTWIPLATVEKINDFFAAAEQASATTRTPDDPEGITIPWEEVTAAWAVLYDQDFSAAGEEAIENLAGEWAERHERVEVHSDGQGNTWTETHVWYTRRDFQEVMERLGFTREQREQARRYLEALREGGLRPPAGWRARPRPGWTWPVPGYDSAAAISSPYGLRVHPITKRPQLHLGVDIVAPEGTPVVAVRAGMVTGTGTDEKLGRYVVIEGGGFETRYGHLSVIGVRQGERVEAGQGIGRVGNTGLSTGPHLDFRVRFGGWWQNPLQYF